MDSRLSKISKILGDPYFSSKNCLIYNIDCVQAMRDLCKKQAALFDLTITSPPYNIGKKYENVLPLEKYLNWSERWIHLVYELTKSDGAFWLNLGYLSTETARALPITYLLWDKIPFYLMQEIVWNYEAGVACKKALSPRNEKFLWYVKDKNSYTFNLDAIRNPDVKYPNQRKNGRLRCNPLGKNPGDVWRIPKVTSGKNRSSVERTIHPAQFPLALIQRIIRGFSNQNDIVFDPFLGSGTVAYAALQEGRCVVGFEIRKDYCDIAIQRLQNNGICNPNKKIKI